MVNRSAQSALVLIGSLLLAGASIAQTSSDLSVAMTYTGFDDRTLAGFWLPPPTSSGGSITRSRPQRLTISVFNQGPNPLDRVYLEFFTPADRSAFLAVNEVACPPDRTTPLSGLRLDVGPVGVGERRDCAVDFRPADGAPAFFTVPLTATAMAVMNTDPASANNQVRLGVFGALDDYIRDMDLSIRSPTGVLAPGTSHLFDVTLTNRGPGPEGVRPGEIAYSQRYEAGLQAVDRFGFSETGDPDCRYRVTDLGGDTFSRSSELVFEPLPPGTSRTCTMRVHVLSGASGVRTLEFYNWAEGHGVFDENLANNRARLILQFPAIAVDAGTRVGWGAMAMALFVLAAMAIRTRMR